MNKNAWRNHTRMLPIMGLLLLLLGFGIAGCAIPVAPPPDDGGDTQAPAQTDTAAEILPEDTSAETEVTEAEAPPAVEEDAATSPTSPREFVLDDSQTEARFIIEETLGGIHTVVTGVSSAVTGSLTTGPDRIASTELSPIVIDATSFVTDNNMRNGAIRRFVLYTNLYPEIIFTPTKLHGTPALVTVGEDFALDIEGTLSILDTVRSVTFAVTARFTSATELVGYGSTQILLEDFGITVPMPPRVTWVADEVLLELDFTAVAPSAPATGTVPDASVHSHT